MTGITKEIWNGKNVYRLVCGGMEVLAAPEDGMNLYQMSMDGMEVITFIEEKYQRKATYGVPVLYPTPNRSAGLKIHVKDREFHARMHGLVKNLPFEAVEAVSGEENVRLTGCLTWDEKQADFGMFPFLSQLYITIEVKAHEMAWSYRIENQGKEELPYGIAIHPYFSKRGQRVKVSVPADAVMEMTDERIPTGKLALAAGTDMDLRMPAEVDSLHLDHVFTECEKGKNAEIFYEDLKLELETSEEFTHVVVFTPDADFFCIENQSCSTDCFNLYARGYKRESGLDFVKPGESKGGFIRFKFQKEE